MSSSTAIVAIVQAAPIHLDLERSLARAVELIGEAARRRAQLVVFPESWLPGYPAWLDLCRDVALWDHPPMKRLYARLMENSVAVPGRVTQVLAETARRHHVTLVIGVHERIDEGAGRGTIYNSVLTIGPEGTLLNINVPGGTPEGVDVTSLGRRLYRDELELVEGSDPGAGRRQYRIYGYEPGLDDKEGTDVGSVARSRISVTPLHLDLTHHGSLDGLRQRDFERVLQASIG